MSSSESPQVFISHTSQDKEFVERLAKDLSRRGLNVWLDRWEIRPGQNWQEAISSALDDSDVYLLVVNPSPSTWQRSEWSTALERSWVSRDKTVIPLLLHGASPPAGLKNVQAIIVDEPTAQPPKAIVDEIVRAVRERSSGHGERATSTAERELSDRLLIVDSVIAELERDSDREGEDRLN